jgi:hypothetical protein
MPWKRNAPTTFIMGLQKSGTTLVGATLAAAMNSPYQPEAVWDCCEKLGINDCARKESEFEETYNFLPHGRFFSKDMRRFFEKCKDHTLLGPPQQVATPSGGTEERRFTVGVLKADEMVQDAAALADFARAERLNFQLVYVARHPLTVIRATQSWIAYKQKNGKHAKWGSDVGSIANLWRKAARVYTQAPVCTSQSNFPGSLSTPGPPEGATGALPRCVFAAVVRFEDLMAAPHDTVVDLYSTLYPRSGGHFPGRPPPPRSAAFPAGWFERVTKAMDTKQNHPDDYMRHNRVNESFTDDDISAVGHDGGHELMKSFNYSMADVYQTP